jgi:sigma-E factor negative regulatory protein RseB
MRFIPFSVLLLGSWLALPAVADEGQDLLQRLADAERTQSFQGTFVYERNGSFSTHSIWHRVEEDGALRERLLQLDGSAQEVVRVGGQVQCASGALADQLIDSQLWPARGLDAAQLSEWYELRLAWRGVPVVYWRWCREISTVMASSCTLISKQVCR